VSRLTRISALSVRDGPFGLPERRGAATSRQEPGLYGRAAVGARRRRGRARRCRWLFARPVGRSNDILVKTGPAGCVRAGPKFQKADYATRPGQQRYTALSRECPGGPPFTRRPKVEPNPLIRRTAEPIPAGPCLAGGRQIDGGAARGAERRSLEIERFPARSFEALLRRSDGWSGPPGASVSHEVDRGATQPQLSEGRAHAAPGERMFEYFEFLKLAVFLLSVPASYVAYRLVSHRN
jgi:hypothetical protein